MTTIKLRKVLFLATIAAGMLAAGCELIVDFDRTTIPVAEVDSGIALDAAGLNDGSQSTGDADTSETSTPVEAGPDADTDSGIVDAAADG